MSRYAERTEVSSDRSRAEIERTLRRYGASAFAYGWDHQRATIAFEMAGRRILFRLPMPDPTAPEFIQLPDGSTVSGRRRSWPCRTSAARCRR